MIVLPFLYFSSPFFPSDYTRGGILPFCLFLNPPCSQAVCIRASRDGPRSEPGRELCWGVAGTPPGGLACVLLGVQGRSCDPFSAPAQYSACKPTVQQFICVKEETNRRLQNIINRGVNSCTIILTSNFISS